MPHRAHLQAGLQALQSGDPGEALRRFDQALEAAPGWVDATYLGGLALVASGHHDDGVARLRRAIALAPRRAALHYNLGKVLQDAGHGELAAPCYREALRLQPRWAEAQTNLALVLKERGETAEASALFQRSFETRKGSRGPVAESHTTRMRLAHDLEQLAHLAGQGVDTGDARAALAAVLSALPDGDGRTQHALTPGWQATLGPVYGRALHIEPGAALDGPVLGHWDRAAAQARYQAATPSVCVVDGLLSAQALEALRQHCLDSTFWHDSRYRGGYLGAYWEQGFGSPLLVQIAAELRAALPELLADHPLQQLWAYKYDAEGGGIGVHADSAAVNVNFWLTPDDANLDPDSGGLVVHHVKAPPGWDHHDYNSWDSEDRIEAFIAEAGTGETVVPHRQNRGVIFDSDLFHRTDRYRFQPGYLHRRLNVTMLFGWRQGRR